mmetsp:Transcript_73045/g.214014  ORF Transcript_73045/g.214014 Transcript_73045/m.214014 type:complete len:391 (+) Transcript_73045:1279-2451(+)
MHSSPSASATLLPSSTSSSSCASQGSKPLESPRSTSPFLVSSASSSSDQLSPLSALDALSSSDFGASMLSAWLKRPGGSAHPRITLFVSAYGSHIISNCFRPVALSERYFPMLLLLSSVVSSTISSTSQSAVSSALQASAPFAAPTSVNSAPSPRPSAACASSMSSRGDATSWLVVSCESPSEDQLSPLAASDVEAFATPPAPLSSSDLDNSALPSPLDTSSVVSRASSAGLSPPSVSLSLVPSSSSHAPPASSGACSALSIGPAATSSATVCTWGSVSSMPDMSSVPNLGSSAPPPASASGAAGSAGGPSSTPACLSAVSAGIASGPSDSSVVRRPNSAPGSKRKCRSTSCEAVQMSAVCECDLMVESIAVKPSPLTGKPHFFKGAFQA